MLDTSKYLRYNGYMRRKNKEQPMKLNDEQLEAYLLIKIFCTSNWDARVRDLSEEIKQLFEVLDKVGWTRTKKYISVELSQSYASTRFLEVEEIQRLIKLDIAEQNFGE